MMQVLTTSAPKRISEMVDAKKCLRYRQKHMCQEQLNTAAQIDGILIPTSNGS